MKKLFTLILAISFSTLTFAQSIGMIGDFTNWSTDEVMNTSDNVTFTLTGYTITVSGGVKFRQDADWLINWGAAAFPSGTGFQNGPDIPVPAGTYDITFDITTGNYSFIAVTNGYDLIGFSGGFNNFTSVEPMITTDGIIYTKSDFYFSGGQVKFVRTQPTPTNWGGSNFPSGTAQINGQNIPLTPGFYNVSFNKNTLEYNFIQVPIGLIGSAIPPYDWSVDVPMTSTDGGVTNYLYNYTILDGSAKFRANGGWATNWGGGTGFPSGIASLGAGNMPVAAGTYDTISFNRLTGQYCFGCDVQSLDVQYCTPPFTGGCLSGDVIARVILNTLDNNTGTDCPSATLGYEDYTTTPGLTTTLLPSASYNCVVFTGDYSGNFAIWIDYNDDGSFDLSERIGYTSAEVLANSSASFPVILGCNPPAGIHRMRIREVYDLPGMDIDPCAEQGFFNGISYGETEDYLITIAPAPLCPSPGLLSATGNSSTSLNLQWSLGCSAATNYDIEYGIQGFTPGTGTVLTNVSANISNGFGIYTLTGLAVNTTYSVYYRANCGNGNTSAWSLEALGTTLCDTTFSSDTVVACDSYDWNGLTYFQSGVYEFYTSNSYGCDSIATLYLTINNNTSESVTIITCDSYSWNGTVYNETGTFYYTGTGNCSATDTLYLTILNSTTSTQQQTACGSFEWNGVVYTQSGTYTFDTLNAVGCDSVATLVLTINQPSTSTTIQTSCGSYDWNGVVYTQSGTYTFETTNAVGCDSTATLELTIVPATGTSTSATACNSYTWSLNNSTYTTSGVYTFNSSGCIIDTLYLTINNSPLAAVITVSNDTILSVAQQNGITYQWINCDNNSPIEGANSNTFNVSENGSYAVIVSNQCGQDTSDCQLVEISNVSDINLDMIQIYPNPTEGQIVVDLLASLVNNNYEILDLYGRTVLEGKIESIKQSISLENLSSGTYQFKLSGSNEVKSIVKY